MRQKCFKIYPCSGQLTLQLREELSEHVIQDTLGKVLFVQGLPQKDLALGQSAALFLTTFSVHADGEGRGLDRIRGWCQKGLGETRLSLCAFRSA